MNENEKDLDTNWFGDIPIIWDEIPISRAFIPRNSKVSDKDFQPLSVTKNGIMPQIDGVAKTDNNDQRKLVITGDYVINSRSDRKGSSGLSSMDGSVSMINTIFYPRNPDQMDMEYYHFLFRSFYYCEEFYRNGTGIVDDLWSTNWERMKRIKIPIPPKEKQISISTFLKKNLLLFDALIEKKQKLIELLQEKRQTIIDENVTKGLDRNAPMKDSGIEWLGSVPAQWEIKRLKFIADVRSGVTKGKDLSGKKVIELPYLRVANVQDGYLDLSDVTTIQVAEGEEKRYQLKYGDVLMNEGGDYDKLGRGAKWESQIEPCLHQNHVFAVRPIDLSHSDWLDLTTSTSYAKFYFMMNSKQTTNLASISSSSIKELPVLLPPGEEREELIRYIRAKTSVIDTLISKVKLQLEKLQEYRQSLISEAVTGKIDVRSYGKEVAQ